MRKNLDKQTPNVLLLDIVSITDIELPVVWVVDNLSDVDARGVWDMRHNRYERVYDHKILVGLEPKKTEMPRVQQILGTVPPAMRATLPEDDLEAALQWSIQMLDI